MSASEILEARKIKGKVSFSDWLCFLDHSALSIGFKRRIVNDTGAECWMHYYEDGYTPLQALIEDLGHAR